MNSIYVILIGSVNCYADKPETRSYLKQLRLSNTKVINPVEVDEDENYLPCVDDNVLDLEKDQLTINDLKKKLELVKGHSYGEFFGSNIAYLSVSFTL